MMKNLVEYSSSESENEDNEQKNPPNEQKKQVLPMLLPRLITKDEKLHEDPESHEMRIRSFGHVEGNWATHVYIDCKLSFYLDLT